MIDSLEDKIREICISVISDYIKGETLPVGVIECDISKRKKEILSNRFSNSRVDASLVDRMFSKFKIGEVLLMNEVDVFNIESRLIREAKKFPIIDYVQELIPEWRFLHYQLFSDTDYMNKIREEVIALGFKPINIPEKKMLNRVDMSILFSVETATITNWIKRYKLSSKFDVMSQVRKSIYYKKEDVIKMVLQLKKMNVRKGLFGIVKDYI